MSDFSYSAVLILPAAQRDAGNQLAIAMGHDVPPGSTYSVPLSPIGGGQPTHYGCRADVTEAFKATIEAAQQGSFPEHLEGAAPVVAALIASFLAKPLPYSPAEHFEGVAHQNGLEIYAPETPE